MDVRVNDILQMKKTHPCGSREWKVLRSGMDFRLRCLGCGHEVLLPRSKAEKGIKAIHRAEESLDGQPVSSGENANENKGNR